MLTKIVNGVEVEMSAEEEAAIRAQWAAADAAKEEYEATEKYKDQRKSEYPTLEQLTVALWEKVVENRPEAADELQAIREEVKARYPKPE